MLYIYNIYIVLLLLYAYYYHSPYKERRTSYARLAHTREYLHDRHARPPRVLDTLYKAADSHMLGTSILNKYT